MKLFLSLLLVTLSLAVNSTPVRADADLDAANRAYTYGSYQESANLIRKLIAERGYSAPLCFNLANAEAQSGHPGQALLNYERARYLAPGDADIDHNLQLARKQAGLQPNSYRWWQIMIRSINWTVWLALIGVCVALVVFALLATSLAKPGVGALGLKPPALRLTSRLIFFICIPLALLFGFVELSAIGFNDRIEGVVVASKQATVYLSPFNSSDKVGTLPEGELVTVENRRGDFFYIVARDKQAGWVEQKDLEPILADSFAVKPAE